MRIKLDENLSRHLRVLLEARQHDIRTAADEDLLSKPDQLIAKAARKEGRMVFSLDTDFADIRTYAPGSHPGIIVFRPRSFGPLTVGVAAPSIPASPGQATRLVVKRFLPNFVVSTSPRRR